MTEIWHRNILLYAYYVLMFIFSKFLSVIFWGQISPHNLKIYKMTQILCRGSLLYAYYDVNVYLFQIFCQSYFCGQFGHTIWSFPHWLKFLPHITTCLLWFWYLFFAKLCHSNNFGQICSLNPKFSRLTEIWYKGTFLYADYGLDV